MPEFPRPKGFIRHYIFTLLVSLDQFGNTLMGGDEDETISSRSAKANRAGKRWGKVMCSFLNFFQEGHCEKSIEMDEGSNATVPDPQPRHS